jgi:pSer/pThr/pTyr-binding forkhead associated (FHA) protein
MESFILRFIAGRYDTAEFPVEGDRPIVIGSASDLDMVLVDKRVSSQHACVSVVDGQVWIEDLESADGTFVNGEKIGRVQLRDMDRVSIGTSTFELRAPRPA